jgi:hypothetical protein
VRGPQPLPQEKRRLVFVEWEDASGPSVAGWKHVQAMDFTPGYICWSVGWTIAEDRTHLHLAAHFGNVQSEDDEQLSGMMSIPKRMIRRKITLPRPKQSRLRGSA